MAAAGVNDRERLRGAKFDCSGPAPDKRDTLRASLGTALYHAARTRGDAHTATARANGIERYDSLGSVSRRFFALAAAPVFGWLSISLSYCLRARSARPQVA